MLSADEAGRILFHATPHPLWLVDEENNVSPVNSSAEAVCAAHRAAQASGVSPPAVAGALAADGSVDGFLELVRRAVTDSRTVSCSVAMPDGGRKEVELFAVEVVCGGHRYTVAGLTARAEPPDWALRDPVTGLGNRHLWERELPRWSSRSGCVVFLDLDDLKEVNDLHGHVAGDRTLAAVGHTLAALVPPDALLVRYGGDEFVAVLPIDDESAVGAWAQDALRHVASVALPARLPVVPRLSHGVAAFGPGGLRDAVQRADDVLYERRGVLLPAMSGGRIILTREGRRGLRGPGDDRVSSQPGAFGTGFGPEFEDYLRTQYARAMEQARGFVAFVDPEPGSAAVEVGAGSGRITFDGGLAERVGPLGQLLVTDPSGAQLQAARRHAQGRGLDWVRFLRASAEDLPLASGTADLALGALFLHFTRPERALHEMARVVRPGGRVAISAGLEHRWPPAWREALEPVRRLLETQGLALQHFFLRPGQLEEMAVSAGLSVERSVTIGPHVLEFPSAELAVGFWRQVGLVRLLLRGHGGDRLAHVQEEFERRVRAGFAYHPPAAWSILDGRLVSVVARRPA